MVPTRLPQLGVFPRRVALEPRPREVLWAESAWRPGGPKLIACGSEPCAEGEKLDALLKRLVITPWLRDAEVAMAIRHPDMKLERLELPKLSNRDARIVATRRVEELASDQIEATISGCVIAHGSGPRPAWLLTCPEEFAAFAERRWLGQGLRVSHFGSAQLALASLTRTLPPQEGERLSAFLDISADHAMCVLADADGWVFGREIPIKIAGATRGRDGADPLERLATELRRTFHYVEAERRAGTVTQLVLSGTRKRLPELAVELRTHLGFDVQLVGDAISDGPAVGANPALASVIGLAIGWRLGGGNLLPPPARRRVAQSRTTRLLAAAAILPALALLVGVLHTTLSISSLSARAEALEADWGTGNELRRRIEANTAARAAAETVQDALEVVSSPRPSWAALLRSLGHLLPEEAFVSGFEAARVDGEWLAGMRIEFRADDLASATGAGARFADRLDQTPLWAVRQVEREQPPQRPSQAGARKSSQVRAHFRIDALLAPVRDARLGASPEAALSSPPTAALPASSRGETERNG